MQYIFGLLLLPFLLTPGGGHPTNQDKAVAKPAMKIEAFAWLAGQWRGQGLGGTCEEIWSHPLAGAMVGTFRLVKEGKVVFYEIMVLDKDEKGFALKVKHFSKEFVAWENKADAVRFGAESVTKNSARFSGLTMKRDGDKFEIKVKMRGRDGKTRWEPFKFERYPPRRR